MASGTQEPSPPQTPADVDAAVPEIRGANQDVARAETVVSRRPSVAGGADAQAAGAESAWWQELGDLTLDHYRITGRIAVGGMGAVFRATNLRLKRDVALKVLPPDQSQEPELVRRFYQEAQAAAQLDHENIARVYYIGQDHGLHYIAFEFVAGANVRDMLAEHGRLDVDVALEFATQVARALHHASTRGVVHRDIKPSNLIVTPGGRVKMVDMGLARRFERRRETDLTHTGVTLGTFDYISPEQARDPRTADVRSDVYSLGCTLYHMVTGQPPFPEGTVLQKLLQHQSEAPRDPRQLNPDLPDVLARVIARMIAKKPRDRYQTAEEVLLALQEAAYQIRPEPVHEDPEATGSTAMPASAEGLRWWERHLVWAGPLVALVVIVVLLYGGLGQRSVERPGATADGPSAESTAAVDDVENTLSHRLGGPDTPSKADQGTQGAAQPRVTPAGDKADGTKSATDTPDVATVDRAVLTPALGLPAGPTASGPRLVAADGNLRDVCQEALVDTRIELTSSGRADAYDPRVTRRTGEQMAVRITGQRLVIAAAEGARPVIRLTYDPRVEAPDGWTLFELVASDVTFEGIEFLLDVGQGDKPMQALVAVGSIVRLHNCTFTQRKIDTGRNRVTAIDVRPTTRGQNLARIEADGTFFRGGRHVLEVGQTGGSFRFRNCIIADYLQPIAVRAGGELPAVVALQNVTGWASMSEPFFELERHNAAIEIDHCIVHRQEPNAVPLAVVQDADALKGLWTASHNVYNGFPTLLGERNGQNIEARAKNLYDLADLLDDRDAENESSTAPPRFQGAERDEDGNWRVEAFRLQPTSPVFTVRNIPGKAVGALLPYASGETQPAVEAKAAEQMAAPAPGESGAKAGTPGTEKAPSDPKATPTAGQGAAGTPSGTTRTENGTDLVDNGWPGALDPWEDLLDDPLWDAERFGAEAARPDSHGPRPATAKTGDGGAALATSVPGKGDLPTTGGEGDPAGAGEAKAAIDDVTNVPPTTEKPARKVLVVGLDEPAQYQSLSAACRAAESGDTIRIEQSGVLAERSIEVTDKVLTIEAADGHNPVIKARATKLLDRSDKDAQLFRVVGGGLRLVGLGLELELADDSPRHWAFIRADDADVELTRCTVSARLGEGREAVLVDVNRRTDRPLAGNAAGAGKPGPVGEGPAVRPEGGTTPTAVAEPTRAGPVIRLRDCHISGVVDAIGMGDHAAGDIRVERTVVLAVGSVLRISGSSIIPTSEGRVRVRFERSTLVFGHGLVALIAADPTRQLMPMSVAVVDSICGGAAESDGTLVVGRTWNTQASALSLLTWESTHSLMVGAGPLLRIEVADATKLNQTWDRDQWLRHWHKDGLEGVSDKFATTAGFVGGAVDLTRPDRHSPADLQLRTDSSGIAMASDGGRVGAGALARHGRVGESYSPLAPAPRDASPDAPPLDR